MRTWRAVPGSPEDFDAAVERWRELPTEDGASFDTEVEIDASSLSPMVTWGTTPGMVVEVTDTVPDPSGLDSPADREAAERALAYMALEPGTPMSDIRLDRVFIGSCTNSRIEDLRAAAGILAESGARASGDLEAMVVPGSQQVKAQAESEGLHEVFEGAGFEWRSAGCSMCLGMNPDILAPGERCASTSNRNFEGRQGRGGRTHLVSPADGGRGRRRGPLRRRSRVVAVRPVDVIEGNVSVLDRSDVDTDQIIPKQFLKRVERTGFGEFLFYDWIRSGEIELEPNPILVTGRNFGSGSSREHAPWALQDFGFEAIVAPSFADIFYANCTKIGLLPVILGEEECRAVAESGTARIDVDDQTVEHAGGVVRFEIDEEIKHRLRNGLDDIGLTLQNASTRSAPSRTRAAPIAAP